jgi:hypothetical protein
LKQIKFGRHGRAYPGHPRLACNTKDVDARHKPGMTNAWPACQVTPREGGTDHICSSIQSGIMLSTSNCNSCWSNFMTHALNLTLPIKQDAETQANLKQLAEIFPTQIQPLIEAALKESRLVHFARVVVIDNKYIQVLTEYEGPHQEYTEFFRRTLAPGFAGIFALAGAVPDLSSANAFFEFSKDHNIRPLGNSTDGSTGLDGKPAGWVFSAYNHKTVEEILTALE